MSAIGWARFGELRTGKLRCGGSRRSGSGAVWLGTVRLVKAVGVGCGVVRFGTVGQGGLGLVR